MRDANVTYNLYIDGFPEKVVVVGPCNLTFQGNTSETGFIQVLREPSLGVMGRISASYLKYPSLSPYFIPMELNGIANITIGLGSQDNLNLKEILFNGEWVSTAPVAGIQWDEWDIPWLTILLSPFSVVLAFLTIGTIIIYLEARHIKDSKRKKPR
jgi:hypothetical protein